MYSSTMNLDGVLVVSIIILVFVSSISFAQECANNQGKYLNKSPSYHILELLCLSLQHSVIITFPIERLLSVMQHLYYW